MFVEQWVMAYKVDQDRIRAMLPYGFESLRPVMRINTEIRDSKELYIEFNTPVEGFGRRGWLNIGNWSSKNDPIAFTKDANITGIRGPFIEIEYELTDGIGGCPAEKDNEGCFFIDGNDLRFEKSEKISSTKIFCDCSFKWMFNQGDAHGISVRETFPAFREEKLVCYEKRELNAENAAAIDCIQVLGTYVVNFER